MTHPALLSGTTLALLVTLLAPVRASAAADAPLIAADRPGFGHAVSVVPARHVQLELGVDVGLAESATTLTAPILLGRYGLLDVLELRLHAPSVVHVVPDSGSSDTAPSPVGVGLKFAVPLGDVIALGALVQLFSPVRGKDFDDSGMTVDLRGLWSLSLGAGFSLGGDVVIDFTRLGAARGETDREYAISLGLGWSALDWLGVYVEGRTAILESAANDAGIYVEGGLTFLPLRWLQVDLYAGGELRNVPDLAYVGGGLAMLF